MTTKCTSQLGNISKEKSKVICFFFFWPSRSLFWSGGTKSDQQMCRSAFQSGIP